MAGSVLSNNFSYIGKNPNFDRDKVSSLATLLAVDPDDQHYDYGHIVFCEEDGKHYKFMYQYGVDQQPAGNQYNSKTGWFQEFADGTSSDGGITSESDPIFMASPAAGITADDIEAWNNKVDSIEGKGLSTNDFTTTLKNKLDGIASGAEVNVQSDWNATSGDAFIKNKPTFKTINNTSILGSGNIEITTEGGGITSESDPVFMASPAAGITADDIEAWNNKVDSIEGKGLSTNDFTTTLKNKLDGIASGAEVNVQSDWNATSGDAYIKNKPTFKTINGNEITGSGNIEIKAADGGITSESDPIFMASPAAGITADDIEAWNNKVDSIEGKGLSTNDFTTTLKNKLDGIASGAEVNVQSDWNATSGDAFIKNKPTFSAIAMSGSYDDLSDKPTIPTALSQLTQSTSYRTVTDIEKSVWNNKQDAISDLETIRSGAAKGATALQTEQYKGTYTKPSTGIPESDLASAVQTSLDKAKNAFTGTVNYKSEGTVVAIDKIIMNNKEYTPQGSETHVDLGVVAPAYAEYTGTSTNVVVTTKYGIFPTTSDGLVEGVRVAVKIEGALSLIKTLNVNSTGEKNVYYNGNSLSSGTIKQYNTYEFIYDGSYYRIIGINTDTNTHYTAMNIVGASSSAKANAAATNGNVHLNLVENSTVRSSHSISGVGGVSVESDESGNILITGTSAYALVNHGTSDTTFTLTPNTFHVWGIVSSLTLTFGSETEGVANEYLFQFSCSSSVTTTLSLPSSVMWADGETPAIEVMKTYQVSILNNCATIQSFG